MSHDTSHMAFIANVSQAEGEHPAHETRLRTTHSGALFVTHTRNASCTHTATQPQTLVAEHGAGLLPHHLTRSSIAGSLSIHAEW
jgi:hypothetical protein